MIATTCEKCKFKVMDGNTQIGCELGILDKFSAAGAEITDRFSDGSLYKVVNRVCQFRRNEGWEGDIASETFIPTTIVILHKDNDLDGLEGTIRSIEELYTPKPPRIVLCHSTKNPREITNILNGKQITQIYMIEELYDNAIYDEAFKRCKNGWIFFVNSGFILDPSTLDVLNFALNDTMGTFLATTGIEAYMAVVYKYFKGQLGISLVEKLREIDPTSVIDWSIIDENYRLLH